MSSDSVVRSREEDDVLQQSTKKVKESYQNEEPSKLPSSNRDGKGRSYKEKLLGLNTGAYEHTFAFENDMDTEVESDADEKDLPLGEVAVRLSGVRKASIRAAWNNALIVKVFGKTVGYHFMVSSLTKLWKLEGKMVCIALGHDFFLIRFSVKKDYSRVLRNGLWFVAGHYLSIRRWEPNFQPSSANMSAVAMWIRLPELPIEYYEESVLRDIGRAVGPVLKVDTHTALEVRGRFARICVQVNLDEPIVKAIRVSGIRQPVQYEGLSSLCFSCGRVGHKAEGCLYRVQQPAKVHVDADMENHSSQSKTTE
nr:uncharacterized protein LOC112023033 [Quercus suber]POF11677.1 uncharacterized protein CFP56_62253 [Quercus suber]